MKRTFVTFILTLMIFSCGSKKKIITKKSDSKTQTEEVIKKPKKENPIEIKTEPKSSPIINSTTDYISRFKNIAITEMNRSGIPASITLAQGILESGSGKGRLAVKANNHFGIKCHGWSGEKIYHDDDEKQECFRKYKNAENSFKDHSEFLVGRRRYAKLFLLDKEDYKGWAKELRKAGYATDKKYPQKLISLIERYSLYKYDNIKLDQEIDRSPTKHVVAKGETLYSIAKQYNTSVENLQRINSLQTTTISIGQVIYLEKRD